MFAAARRSASVPRCWVRSAACMRSAPRSTGTSFIRPRRRPSSCRCTLPGGQSLAGIRSNPPVAHGPVGPSLAGKPARSIEAVLERRARYGGLELSGGSSDRRLDRLSGRRICRDGARGGPRNFRTGSLRPRRHRISKIPGFSIRMSRARRRWCSIRLRANSSVYVRADASDNSWDSHARGCVRKAADRPRRASISHEFASVVPIVRSRGMLPSICRLRIQLRPDVPGNCPIMAQRTGSSRRDPRCRERERTAIRLSIASRHLDACFQTHAGRFPDMDKLAGHEKGRNSIVPVKIERVRFHASASEPNFRLRPTDEIQSDGNQGDLQILDEDGDRLVEVQGLTAGRRDTARKERAALSTSINGSRVLGPATAAARDSHHVPSPEALAPLLQEEAEALRQRFNRARFQNEFHSLSRATVAAYIVRALRELGWSPTIARRARSTCSPIDSASRPSTTGGSSSCSEFDRRRDRFDGGTGSALEGACGTSSRNAMSR